MKDSEFLSWIWSRLVNVHGENSNVDYMHRLNGIIINMNTSEAALKTEHQQEMEELKPKRTRVEYVKVTESIFDLKGEFERGELCARSYGAHAEEWFFDKIDSESQLISDKAMDVVYRKVEVEIDEKREFIDAGLEALNKMPGSHTHVVLEDLFDSGKFKLVDGE